MLRSAIVLFLMLAGGAFAAEPKGAAVRAYERGARELEFGRFGEAAAAFAEAIGLDPVESREPVARLSGMNFEPYLPHLALGIARCEGGDLSAALTSWAESDRQAAARSARGAKRLLLRREDCSARHRESLRAAEEARVPPDSHSADVVPVKPPPGALRQPAESEPSPPTTAAGSIASPEPPAVPAAVPVLEPPPAVLLHAAQELFDGRPAQTFELLANFVSDRPRARGQSHLLRAAACFDLARLEPGSAALWLARAGEQRVAALRAAPALAADRRFFSPAFVEYFASGSAPATFADLLAR